MKKKILITIISAMTLMSLTACGSKKSTEPEAIPVDSIETETEISTTEESITEESITEESVTEDSITEDSIIEDTEINSANTHKLDAKDAKTTDTNVSTDKDTTSTTTDKESTDKETTIVTTSEATPYTGVNIIYTDDYPHDHYTLTKDDMEFAISIYYPEEYYPNYSKNPDDYIWVNDEPYTESDYEHYLESLQY